MAHPQYGSSRRGLRWYIVAITVIIGIIFLLVMLSGKDNTNDDLTGLVIDDSVMNTETAPTGDRSLIGPVTLTFDNAPALSKSGKISELALMFSDVTTAIKVNGHELEFNDVTQRTLLLKDFEGKIDLREGEIAVKGKAQRIEVNGLAFFAEKGIDVEFSGLRFESLSLPEVKLEKITFKRGNGYLTIGDKFAYTLQDEVVELTKFAGALTVTPFGNSSFTAEGNADSVGIQGEVMDLTLN